MVAKAFNVTRVPIVLPITTGSSFDRMAGLAVSLDDCGLVARGIVRCDQPRALDFQARAGKYPESVPERIIQNGSFWMCWQNCAQFLPE